jgi:benzoate membrane transport protein
MLSQNLPGITMMRGHRYHAPVKPLLIGTGLIQVLLAPFGCFSVNLAAISAAICMNENVDPDKSLRYRSTLWAGFFYLIAGVWAGTVVSLFLALPSEVSHILAGLALLGTLLMCIRTAFTEARYQEGALLTFLITFSGVSFLGISATLWGLLAGFLAIRLSKRSLA